MSNSGLIDIYVSGTRNPESRWREEFLDILNKKYPALTYFSPIVRQEEWTQQAQIYENNEKKRCIVHFYCLSPLMTGVYTIAELVHDSCTIPGWTVALLIDDDNGHRFECGMYKSVARTLQLACRHNGAGRVYDLETAADLCNYLVQKYKDSNRQK